MPDVLIDFASPDDSPRTYRELEIRGRGMRWSRHLFDYDPNGQSYSYLGAKEGDDLAVSEVAVLDRRIVEAVRRSPGISLSALREVLSVRKVDVKARVVELVAAGRLVNQGRGSRYRLLPVGGAS